MLARATMSYSDGRGAVVGGERVFTAPPVKSSVLLFAAVTCKMFMSEFNARSQYAYREG